MDATCLVCHITCTGLPITRAGPGRTWRRRLIPGNRNMTRSHQRMWGIVPLCWRSQSRGSSLGSPRARRVSHRHRALESGVKSAGVAIRARICAVLLGRPLPGHTCQICPWGSELGSWSSCAAGIGPLSLASDAFAFSDSACLSAVELCHTPSSCSGRLGVGDDDCFGAVAWERPGQSRQLTECRQPASRDFVWLHKTVV